MTRVAHLDFESYSLVNLKREGLHRYSMHPSASVLCLAYAINDEEPRVWLPGYALPKDLFTADEFVAFNAGFERAFWWVAYRKYGWPDCPTPDRWRCAQAVALSFALPGDLDGAAQALQLPYRKDPRGKELIQSFCVPYRKTGAPRMTPCDNNDEFFELVRYCQQDVRVERSVLHACPRSHLSPAEQRHWVQKMKTNERGFMIDVPTTRACAQSVVEWKAKLEQEMLAITGDIRPSQRAAVLDWLHENDVEIANMKKNTIADALDAVPEGTARRVLELRSQHAKTSTAKYDVFLRSVGARDRVYYTQTFHGAGTGRVTHRLVQPGNFPRPELKDYKGDPIPDVWKYAGDLGLCSDPYMVSFIFEPMAFYSSLLRSMIVAPPGKLLFSGDYAQIEARMNAYLSGEKSKLAIYEAGGDLYSVMAGYIYNRDPAEIDRKSFERQIGKSAELGAGFGLSGLGFQTYCKDTARIEIDRKTAQHVIDVYRETSPGIVQNWKRTTEAVMNAIRDPGCVYEVNLCKYVVTKDRGWLFCKLPGGRVIAYCRPKLEWVVRVFESIDRETGEIKRIRKNVEQVFVAGVNPRTHQWTERLPAWAGQFVNNYVQGSTRDIMVDASERVEAAGYPVVLDVHDEVIAEADERRSLDEYRSIMAAPVPWAPGLPMKVDAWCGTRYRKG